MNGLKIIRIQCNYSVGELAAEIGVSRQMISAWENGKKSIPESRKMQLAEYFGVEPELIGEINEQKKRDIVNRTFYRWRNDKAEHFRFKPQKEDAEEPVIWLEKKERKNTISEELHKKKKEQKVLLERMKSQADQIKGNGSSASPGQSDHRHIDRPHHCHIRKNSFHCVHSNSDLWRYIPEA